MKNTSTHLMPPVRQNVFSIGNDQQPVAPADEYADVAAQLDKLSVDAPQQLVEKLIAYARR